MATPQIRPFKRIKKRHAWDIPAMTKVVRPSSSSSQLQFIPRFNAWNDPLGLMTTPASIRRPAAAKAAHQVMQNVTGSHLPFPSYPLQSPFPPSLVTSSSADSESPQEVEARSCSGTNRTADSTELQGHSTEVGLSSSKESSISTGTNRTGISSQRRGHSSTNEKLSVYITPECKLVEDWRKIGNNRLRILLSLVKEDTDDYEKSRVAIELVNMVQEYWQGQFYLQLPGRGEGLLMKDEDQVYEFMLELLDQNEYKNGDPVSDLIQESLQAADGEKKLLAKPASIQQQESATESQASTIQKKRAHAAVTLDGDQAVNSRTKVRFRLPTRVSLEQKDLMESSRLVAAAAASLPPQDGNPAKKRKTFPPHPRVSLGQEDLEESARAVRVAAAAAAAAAETEQACPLLKNNPFKKILSPAGMDNSEISKLRKAACLSLKAKQVRDLSCAKRDFAASRAPIVAENIMPNPSDIHHLREATVDALRSRQEEAIKLDDSDTDDDIEQAGSFASAGFASPSGHQPRELSALEALCSLGSADSKQQQQQSVQDSVLTAKHPALSAVDQDEGWKPDKQNDPPTALPIEKKGESKQFSAPPVPISFDWELARARNGAAAVLAASIKRKKKKKKKRPITPPEDREAQAEYFLQEDAARPSESSNSNKSRKFLKPNEAWNLMFERLLQYKQEFGDTLVPYNWDNDRKLADWVSVQRKRFNKGTLAKDRTERLEEVGFVFAVRHRRHVPWQVMFDRLVEHKEQHGHWFPTNNKLARWAADQHSQMVKGRLSEDRVKKLQDIGFLSKACPPKSAPQEQPPSCNEQEVGEDNDSNSHTSVQGVAQRQQDEVVVYESYIQQLPWEKMMGAAHRSQSAMAGQW